MRTRSLLALAVTSMTLCAGPTLAQNLLRNPGFESVPNAGTGQGILPSDWIILLSSPDTYSNDGSYGLPPNTFGNFTGVTAHEGIRWVAAWSAASEEFGQVLSRPLVPGRRYSVSCSLHQALRTDLNHPGAYRLRIEVAGGASAVLGEFPPTVSFAEGWVARSFEFTAPPNAAALMTLRFTPIAGPNGGAYPGIDDIELVETGCVADVDDGTSTGTPDGGVTIDDLLYYLSIFAAGDPSADVDNGTATGTPDGGVTIEDLLYFLARFTAGC